MMSLVDVVTTDENDSDVNASEETGAPNKTGAPDKTGATDAVVGVSAAGKRAAVRDGTDTA